LLLAVSHNTFVLLVRFRSKVTAFETLELTFV